MIACCVKRHRSLHFAGAGRIAKTWRTPFEKAAGPDPETQYQWLHDLADSAADDVKAAFLAAIEKIRGTVKEAELRDALESGSPDRVLDVLGIDEAMAAAIRAEILPSLEDTVIAAGRQAPAETIPAVAEGQISMRFDITNPQVSRFIQQYDFRLIRDISEDTRTAIRNVVSDAMQFGGHPYEQARMIREAIGLTDSQNEAVANFRRFLETGDRQALQRELRDRRFDPTLERTLGADAIDELTPDQIDKMVERYRSRMLDMRAENIARTETIRAAEAGKRMAWEQAADKGLLNRTTLRQGWLVTPDDRLCIYCAAVPLMNLEGVPLGGLFQTPLGAVPGPTLHPQCRCSLYLLAF